MSGAPGWKAIVRAVTLGLLMILIGAGPGLAAETYRVGITAAITGRSGDTFAPFYEGIKAYVHRVNERGGIQGRRIDLVVEDDRGEPPRAAAHAKKLIGTDQVVLMIASTISASYKPIMAEVEAAKAPLLIAGGACAREALPPAQPLVFCSTSFEAKYDGEFAVDFIRRQEAGKRVKIGFVAQDIPISRLANEHAEQYARRQGLETLPVVVVPGAAADFTPFASRLKEGGVDWGLAMALWAIQVGPFESLRRLGWTGRYLLIAQPQGQDELTRLKDETLFAFSGNALFTENLPIHAEIAEAAQRARTKYPAHYLAEGYGSAMVLEAALQRCGWPCDRERLARAMASLTVDMRGLRGGPTEWTETNHYRRTSHYKVYRWDRAQNRILAVSEWTRVEVK